MSRMRTESSEIVVVVVFCHCHHHGVNGEFQFALDVFCSSSGSERRRFFDDQHGTVTTAIIVVMLCFFLEMATHALMQQTVATPGLSFSCSFSFVRALVAVAVVACVCVGVAVCRRARGDRGCFFAGVRACGVSLGSRARAREEYMSTMVPH